MWGKMGNCGEMCRWWRLTEMGLQPLFAAYPVPVNSNPPIFLSRPQPPQRFPKHPPTFPESSEATIIQKTPEILLSEVPSPPSDVLSIHFRDVPLRSDRELPLRIVVSRRIHPRGIFSTFPHTASPKVEIKLT